MANEALVEKYLTNEHGYAFIVVRHSDGKIVGGYARVELAAKSIELGWSAELSWHLVTGDDLALDARCLATGRLVARLHKIPTSNIAFALIL